MIFVSETNVISQNNFGPKTFLVQTNFFVHKKLLVKKKLWRTSRTDQLGIIPAQPRLAGVGAGVKLDKNTNVYSFCDGNGISGMSVRPNLSVI